MTTTSLKSVTRPDRPDDALRLDILPRGDAAKGAHGIAFFVGGALARLIEAATAALLQGGYRASIAPIASLILAGASFPAQAEEDAGVGWDTVSITWDNDLFTYSNTDRHYTNGMHVRLESKPFTAFDGSSVPGLFVPMLDALPISSGSFQQRTVAYSAGQKMFTPDDTTIASSQPDDMPYAGLLYASADFGASAASHADLFRLTIGLVGPGSLAKQTQKAAHRLVGVDDPKGWSHQLGNEIVFGALYERRHLLVSGKWGKQVSFDLVGIGRGEIGTLNTGAEAGLVMVFSQSGMNGHRKLQPDIAGNGYLSRGDLKQGWFGYAGTTGRLTLRNVFLDGNTYRDSPSVDKKPINASVFLGFGFGASSWIASAGWSLESRRFDTQEKGSRYGSLSLTYRYD